MHKNAYFDDTENEDEDDEDDTDDGIDGHDNKRTKSTVRSQIEAKFQAKLEEVSSTVNKILRMVISLTNKRYNVGDSTIAPDFLSIFPLKTEESLVKFERDLSDSAFRNNVVISVFIVYFYSFVTLQWLLSCMLFICGVASCMNDW